MHLGSPKIRKYAPIVVTIALGIIVVAYVVLEILIDSQNPSGGTSLTQTVRSWGYGGVFGLMLLEASSLPVPSEIILPFAGFLVSEGHMDFVYTLAVATAAALAGSLIDYYIGLKGVQALSKYKLLGRSVFSENQLHVAANYFARYGAAMVFVGRLVPVLRTLISFPAGAVKMPIAKFLGYTLAGCLIWNTLLIYVGYYLGVQWREVSYFSHYIVIGVAAACIMAAACYVVRRRKKKRRTQAAQEYVR